MLPQTPLDCVLLAVGTAAGGIIAIVRHPFYIAYSLAWLAAPVATFGPLVAVFAVIQIAIYVIAARREERQLDEYFGAAYRDYKNRTGMFLPFAFRRLPARA